MTTSWGMLPVRSHVTFQPVLDPELPGGTYAIEPAVLAPLMEVVASSRTSGEYRSLMPFTGAPLAALPLSSVVDVAQAVAVAKAAQGAWAAWPLAQRAAVVNRLAREVLRRRDGIIDILQLETGKSRTSAFEEVAAVAQTARHFSVKARAYLADRRVPGMFPVLTRTTVHRRPVGVVGAIAPWNYPLVMALSEAIPALIAGNAVVLKPHPQTSLSALWAVALFRECGLPDAVLQVVTGEAEVGIALIDQVDHIAFTGSTATGRLVAAQAGRRLIGTTLELGGKNPMYVAPDAHLPSAAHAAVRACFANTGQLCVSIERLILHEEIADEFLELFLEHVRGLVLGSQLEYSADVGSLISQAQLDRVIEHIDDALTQGARILAGGVHRSDLGPYFYAPTVLTEVPDHALVATEETFGPVVSVYRVPSDAAAIAMMNNTEYGLNASIWSRNPARARRIGAQVQSGAITINDGYGASYGSVAAPMGGMKASGVGRRHGREAIDALTEPQTVAVQYGASVGLSLDRLYSLGGERPAHVLSQALEAMRVLRRP